MDTFNTINTPVTLMEAAPGAFTTFHSVMTPDDGRNHIYEIGGSIRVTNFVPPVPYGFQIIVKYTDITGMMQQLPFFISGMAQPNIDPSILGEKNFTSTSIEVFPNSPIIFEAVVMQVTPGAQVTFNASMWSNRIN